jgi:hypothetical protein
MVAGVSAESVALDMLVTLMEQAEVDDLENSALTATVQSINPQARNRVRLLADTIAKSHWTVEGTLARRGASSRMITMTHRGAAHLAEELSRTETVPSSRRSYFGTIDGQIRSESMMQFIPDDGRRFKATVPSADLMNEVARLAGTEGLRVSATFEVFEEIPAGQASYVRRSYALQSIRGAPREHQPPLQ